MREAKRVGGGGVEAGGCGGGSDLEVFPLP